MGVICCIGESFFFELESVCGNNTVLYAIIKRDTSCQ